MTEADSSPAETLTGWPLPAEPSLAMTWEAWRLSEVELLGLALLAVLVAAAWFAGRRLVAGFALLVGSVTLAGPIAVYAPVQFSATAAQYLLLAGVVGPLLGQAIYARRTAEPHKGPAAQWSTILLMILLGVSLFSVLLPAAKSEPWLNLAVCAALLGGGVVMGGAVVRQKSERGPAGLLAGGGLLGIGLWLAVNDQLIAAEHFGLTGRTWTPDALTDQRLSSVLFIVAGLVTLVVSVLSLLGGIPGQLRTSTPRNPDHELDKRLKEFFGPR